MDFWGKLEFSLDFELGIPGQRHWDPIMKDVSVDFSLFFSLLRNVSYFNLSSLNFFRSRKQAIYCNDSVLQINSSILWVIETVNPSHTAFQLHSIQWITSLAMLCYTNFLSNFNVNTMAGVISDSSPRNTAVLEPKCIVWDAEQGSTSPTPSMAALTSLWTSSEKFLPSINYKKQPCTFSLKNLTPGQVIKIFPIIR